MREDLCYHTVFTIFPFHHGDGWNEMNTFISLVLQFLFFFVVLFHQIEDGFSCLFLVCPMEIVGHYCKNTSAILTCF